MGRILSRKQRKRLERIVDVKKKKEERGELLEKLAKVQAQQSQLSGWTRSLLQLAGLCVCIHCSTIIISAVCVQLIFSFWNE